MEDNQQRIIALLRCVISGSASEAQYEEVRHWMDRADQDPEKQQLLQQLWESVETEPGEAVFTPDQSESMLRDILAPKPGRYAPAFRRRVRLKWTAAAAVLLLLGAGLWWYATTREPTVSPAALSVEEKDVAPGGNKAILILAGGRQLSLDSMHSGMLNRSGNIQIEQTKQGQVKYTYVSGSKVSPQKRVQYNTLKTPRGGQYQLRLPDGSRVWLNAASSLKYPLGFSDRKREVVLTGEAFFEIKADPARPFYVEVRDTTTANKSLRVEVLGTAFNIQAYSDEGDIKTTLVTGAVAVSKGAATRRLAPGEQARVRPGQPGIAISKVNTEAAVAWKNGYFHFEEETIATIMHKIARWYNVQIVYAGTMPEGTYSGIISRQTPLSEVLKILRLGGLRFAIHGRKLTVMQ